MQIQQSDCLKEAFLQLVRRRLESRSACWFLGIDVSRHGLEDPDNRVLNMPVSEESFVGIGLGMARSGADVFVDLMFETFTCRAWDALVNQASLIRPPSGPHGTLTLRMIPGPLEAAGPQHGGNLTGFLTRLPTIRLAAPVRASDVEDAWLAAAEGGFPLILLTGNIDLPLNDSAGTSIFRRILHRGPPGSNRIVLTSGPLAPLVYRALHDLGVFDKVTLRIPLFLNPLPLDDIIDDCPAGADLMVIEGPPPSVMLEPLGARLANRTDRRLSSIVLGSADPGFGFSWDRELNLLVRQLESWMRTL